VAWASVGGGRCGAARGSNVTAANASYDGTISPGGSVSIGFQGTWTSNDTAPTSFRLNGTACR
jgi:cellulose binding protein with CBM2 domain